MKYIFICLVALWGFIFGVSSCKAEMIASMPNQGGGKIVLTNEVCKLDKKVYDTLRRSYFYTAEGYTSEGCYYVEGDSVMVIWDMADGKPAKRRYPADNFTIIKKSGASYGT